MRLTCPPAPPHPAATRWWVAFSRSRLPHHCDCQRTGRPSGEYLRSSGQYFRGLDRRPALRVDRVHQSQRQPQWHGSGIYLSQRGCAGLRTVYGEHSHRPQQHLSTDDWFFRSRWHQRGPLLLHPHGHGQRQYSQCLATVLNDNTTTTAFFNFTDEFLEAETSTDMTDRCAAWRPSGGRCVLLPLERSRGAERGGWIRVRALYFAGL